MRKALGFLVILLLVAAAAVAVFLATGAPEPRRIVAEDGDPVRGTYLARAGGCVACHTNPKGGAMLAGGAPIETPFGTFYGPNITPHESDGIGAWSLEDFAAAMTAGVDPEGRRLYPVFPYPHYTLLQDQDIADLWAALKTVPATAGSPPSNDLDWPFGYRFLLAGWQALFLPRGPYEPAPGRSDAWNRGRFLVEGPGHCGACHSPRNLLGAEEAGEALSGGPNGPGGEKVPAITATALADAGWTASDVAYALKTGLTPEGDSLGGSMGEVISNGTSFLTDEDRAAIATYLLER